jgi:dihydrofolate synthase/folylpolyglutamate synthase
MQKHDLIVVAEEHITDHKYISTCLAFTNVVIIDCLCCHQLKRSKHFKMIYRKRRHKKINWSAWPLGGHSSIPTVVLDVAHNEDGIKQLVGQVEVNDHHDLYIILVL